MMNSKGNIQMLGHRSLTATAATFFFLLAGLAVAHADPAGAWKLIAGKTQICDLTLAADHTATGCTGIAKWKPTSAGVTLYSGNGSVYGVLASKGDTFVGKSFGYEQTLTLSHTELAVR
jgi:hypothetical protein